MIRIAGHCLLFIVIAVSGCKVRTISDGKPPRDGVLKMEVTDPKYGVLKTEEQYREGHLVFVEGRFQNGSIAFQRLPMIDNYDLDTTVWFYPSGKMFYQHVSSDDRTIFFKELFEDGAVRIVSDTSISNEFYPDGTKNCTIKYQNGFVVSIDGWYRNGKRREQSEWLNDARHGIRREWDSTGRLTVNEKYQRGTLITGSTKQ